jgi:hypothetical protein
MDFSGRCDRDNIVFHTNIDAYKSFDLSMLPNCVPRKGEHVEMPKVYHHGLAVRKLPHRLQVIDVTYKENFVEVELHFDSLDVELWRDADKLSMCER